VCNFRTDFRADMTKRKPPARHREGIGKSRISRKIRGIRSTRILREGQTACCGGSRRPAIPRRARAHQRREQAQQRTYWLCGHHAVAAPSPERKVLRGPRPARDSRRRWRQWEQAGCPRKLAAAGRKS
jgi:hypothetical protein